MGVAKNDWDDRAGLRAYVQFNKYTHTHSHTHPHLSRLIRGFRIIDPPLGGSKRVA